MIEELTWSETISSNLPKVPLLTLIRRNRMWMSSNWLFWMKQTPWQKMLRMLWSELLKSTLEMSVFVSFAIICPVSFQQFSRVVPGKSWKLEKLLFTFFRFRFPPLSKDQIIPRLDLVIREENLNVTEDGKEALFSLSGGDMRKILNVLQSTSLAFNVVDEKNVYACVGQPDPQVIQRILKMLLNETIEHAIERKFLNYSSRINYQFFRNLKASNRICRFSHWHSWKHYGRGFEIAIPWWKCCGRTYRTFVWNSKACKEWMFGESSIECACCFVHLGSRWYLHLIPLFFLLIYRLE